MFPKMVEVVPEGASGNAEVKHFTVSKSASAMSSIRALQHPDGYVSPGHYAQLLVNGGVMMSDTSMEKHSNYEVVHKARGDVLIAGLGLGMILHPIAEKEEVTSVTVVEINPHVIKLVGATVPAKVKIVEGDIFEWKPEKRGRQFDAIYMDIWKNICVDNIEEIVKLHRKFRGYMRVGGWMSSWQYDYLKSLRARSKRNRWG